MRLFKGIEGMTIKRNIAGTIAALLGLAGFNAVRADTVINVTQYAYNYNNQLVCTAVRMNMAITQPADACAPATTVGANGPDRITQNNYDQAGQLLAVYKAVGTSSVIQYAYYNYTPNGKKAFEIDANHNKTTFTYDVFDRLSKIQYPNTTVGNETSSTTDYESFGYDPNGNRTSWRRRDGNTIAYAFDALNHQTYEGGDAVADMRTAYDLQGHLLSKHFTSGDIGVDYAYDGLGRVMSTTDMMGRTVNYAYNAASGRTKLIFPDGTYVQYTLDNLNRVSAAGLNGTSNVLFGQVLDSLGRRKTLSRGISSAGGATTYGYDNLGRLTSLTNNLSGTAYDITWSFSGYNAANQITTWGASSTVYDYVETATATIAKTYDGLNRDATIAAISGGYDSKGNLAKDGTRTMTYDIYNRLLTVMGTGMNLKLVYDTEGRLAKYSTDGGTTYTTFLYDGTNLIGEYNNSGILTDRYIHGTGTDEPLVWYTGSAVTASDQRFLYQNYQGSVIARTDSAGILGDYYRYDPYGVPYNNVINNTQHWEGARFRYPGQAVIREAQLYYYKARVYDPNFGRFLQTDPIGSKDDLDLYAYVAGDPINKTDPAGTEGNELLHGALTVASFCPSVCGSAFSAADGVVSLSEGDSVGAAISFGAAGVGLFSDAGAVKLAGTGLKVGAETLQGSKLAVKAGEEGGQLLFRRGAYDSVKTLRTQADAAEKVIGVHGVSVSTSSAAKEGQVVRCASKCDVEAAGFSVQKTGKDPNHFTVELPKDITKDVAKKWNELFK